MLWKRKFSGSLLAVIGYLLSPLSWWNDAVVNLPLALAFAWLVSFIREDAFGISLVVGYWLTNVAGFVLMHKGANQLLSKESVPYSLKALTRDVGISLLYTGLILLLLKLGVFKPFGAYFPAH